MEFCGRINLKGISNIQFPQEKQEKNILRTPSITPIIDLIKETEFTVLIQI